MLKASHILTYLIKMVYLNELDSCFDFTRSAYTRTVSFSLPRERTSEGRQCGSHCSSTCTQFS